MKKMLMVWLLIISQLSFASQDKIDFAKAHHNVKIYTAGAVMAISGVFVFCNTFNELKKDPQNVTQGTLHLVGTMSAMIGSCMIGYSFAMADRQQETRIISKTIKKRTVVLGEIGQERSIDC